ncbi:hypothetical protein ACIOWE_00320 [Pseudomonas sp. NPDC087598]|uniref:hypothetical protein n=1 Tax=Pseudomonas sp. NPDC087598 TaxID=3364440 RepID=UPI0037FDEC22
MTDSKSTTDDTFTAEVNGSGHPLFSARETSLTRSWRPGPGDYWHGHGGQPISQPNHNAYLNVFVPENPTVGTHQITEDGNDYRASYALGNPGDIDEYHAVSGEITLSVVPTAGDERLEGEVKFIAVNVDGQRQVTVTNGKFKLSAENASTSATSNPK